MRWSLGILCICLFTGLDVVGSGCVVGLYIKDHGFRALLGFIV